MSTLFGGKIPEHHLPFWSVNAPLAWLSLNALCTVWETEFSVNVQHEIKASNNAKFS